MNQLWVEKYRPSRIKDCILPEDLKNTFTEFVDKGYVPNLLLTGGPGVGKTTVARAMLEECGFDYIIINGSMNGNIDTLRTDIKNFASTVSLTGSRKYVILDEADYLNPQSTQPALRNFMEEYSKNCGFILTCNFRNRIIQPLHSRCSVIEFKINGKDKPIAAKNFMERICNILDQEKVTYEKKLPTKQAVGPSPNTSGYGGLCDTVSGCSYKAETIFKPNNDSYMVQGAVDSSDRITRLKLNTIRAGRRCGPLDEQACKGIYRSGNAQTAVDSVSWPSPNNDYDEIKYKTKWPANLKTLYQDRSLVKGLDVITKV